MIDGEALWRSDKLNKVEPIEFRAEYANLLPLALGDGTFEANPRRVWADVYSYNRPDITLELVEEILSEFERVGILVRKTDENGKIWGLWVGIESRLPSESTRDRYKTGKSNLFSNIVSEKQYREDVATESRPNRDRVMLGLDRIGLDMNRSESISADDIPGRFVAGMYPNKNPKKLHKSIVEIWQKHRGPSAVARYPSRFPERWNELCENHSGDIIVPAFELWTVEEGMFIETDYPVTNFLKSASAYMERVVPKITKQKESMEIRAASSVAIANQASDDFITQKLAAQEQERRQMELSGDAI